MFANLVKRSLTLTNFSSKFQTQKLIQSRSFCNFYCSDLLNSPRDVDNEIDVLIVGAGPAGLAAAIKTKQLCLEKGKDLRVVVVEKGENVGDHILSGAVIDPIAVTELIPDWKEKGAPLTNGVKEDNFYYLTEKSAIPTPPLPPYLQNHGYYIASLGNLTRWLGEQAEELGVDIYSGISASEVIYSEDKSSVLGIATSDLGIGKDDKPTEAFERGMELHAKMTLFGEGCRGSLTEGLTKKFGLRDNCDPALYSIGLKEVWEIPEKQHKQGKVVHTLGWPLKNENYGGTFLYHMENNQISLGMVVGLDYKNPYLNPYKEFQRWKHHPSVAAVLEGGKPLSYGARALNGGGIQSVPKLIFPGGALIGCTAGFMNVPKIKGSHTAMKTGILAAEAIFDVLTDEKTENKEGIVLDKYPKAVENSWIYEELNKVRNVKPLMHKFGTILGTLLSGAELYLQMIINTPWTLSVKEHDHEALKPASECEKIEYPKPDGKISFDLLSNLARSGTNHNDKQPSHLRLRNAETPVKVNLAKFDGPENRFCPAGVYEYAKNDQGEDHLVINAQNCLHCKTCSIKDPTQNINWTVPEGGGGPAYSNM